MSVKVFIETPHPVNKIKKILNSGGRLNSIVIDKCFGMKSQPSVLISLEDEENIYTELLTAQQFEELLETIRQKLITLTFRDKIIYEEDNRQRNTIFIDIVLKNLEQLNLSNIVNLASHKDFIKMSQIYINGY